MPVYFFNACLERNLEMFIKLKVESILFGTLLLPYSISKNPINKVFWLACICGTVLMKMTMMTFSSSTPIYQKTEVNFFQLILEVVVQFLRQYKLTGNSSTEVYPDPVKHLILCVLKTLHLKCLKVFLIRFWSSIRNNVFW